MRSNFPFAFLCFIEIDHWNGTFLRNLPGRNSIGVNCNRTWLILSWPRFHCNKWNCLSVYTIGLVRHVLMKWNLSSSISHLPEQLRQRNLYSLVSNHLKYLRLLLDYWLLFSVVGCYYHSFTIVDAYSSVCVVPRAHLIWCTGSPDEFIPLPNLTVFSGVFLSRVRLLVDTKQKSKTGLLNSGFCSCARRTNV